MKRNKHDYDLAEINFKTVADPKGFLEECDAVYHGEVREAAALIAEHLSVSPIVLLSGPSGSGKTTTAMKIAEALEEKCYAIKGRNGVTATFAANQNTNRIVVPKNDADDEPYGGFIRDYKNK